MRKYIAIGFVSAAVIFLSGCSMTAPSTPAAQKPTEYQLSKSIWKSTDGGKTWEAKNITLKKPTVTDLDILRIAVNPQDSSNIYVALRSGGLIKSTDSGDHWEFTNFTSEKAYGLEIDPTDGKTLYVSGVWQGRGKIFKSEDGGGNWKEVYTAAANGPLIVAMALDHNNRQLVYAANSDKQVIKSVDGGTSWKNIYASRSPIIQIALDKSDSNLIFLLTSDGNALRSTNGGGSFEDFSSNISRNLLSAGIGRSFKVLKTDPGISGSVYLAGNNGIIHSKDGGNTWEKIATLDNPENFPTSALAVSPQNSQDIFYGASQAAYKSVDGGENWIPFQFDGISKTIGVIEVDPKNPNIIYAGFKK